MAFVINMIPFAFSIRENKDTGDANVIREVIENDCYKLRNLKNSGFEPKVIFDIGAHIGAFTVLANALFHNAELYCFEPNLENSMLLRENTPYARVYNTAIDYGNEPLIYIKAIEASGSGFISSFSEAPRLMATKTIHDNVRYLMTQENIERLSIEEVVEYHNIKAIDLLKMDCEGGEWDIVENISDEVAVKVKNICGEYHTFNSRSDAEFLLLLQKKFPHLKFTIDSGKTHGLFYSY